MSKNDLRDYNEAHGLPILHSKKKLMEQARTRKPQRGPRKAQKDKGKSAFVQIDEDAEVKEDFQVEGQIYTDPEVGITRSTANEPVVRDRTYHDHKLSPPLAEEEPRG